VSLLASSFFFRLVTLDYSLGVQARHDTLPDSRPSTLAVRPGDVRPMDNAPSIAFYGTARMNTPHVR
jgi:hypothetical protein